MPHPALAAGIRVDIGTVFAPRHIAPARVDTEAGQRRLSHSFPHGPRRRVVGPVELDRVEPVPSRREDGTQPRIALGVTANDGFHLDTMEILHLLSPPARRTG